MSNEYKVCINNETIMVAEGTRYIDLALRYQRDFAEDILLVSENDRLRELHARVKGDCKIRFITALENEGLATYRRSMSMLMIKAFYDVLGDISYSVTIHFSVSSGYFCTLEKNGQTVHIDNELLEKTESRMKELVERAIVFEKSTIKTDEAPKLFANSGMEHKASLLKYRSASNTNVYKLDGFMDYFYGFMVYDTSYLKWFKLYPYDDGFVLQMPSKTEPKTVAAFKPSDKVYRSLKESEKWANMLGSNTVGKLNDIIVRGDFQELILVQEALQEAKIAEIADMIKAERSKRFIMIAGPSSSGKTTFSRRMCVQLLAHGLKPHAISVDNYYVEREKTPRDENGDYDFENITAIDTDLFNNNMEALLRGEKINMPYFNFVTGHREYHDDYIQLFDDDVLVIEGIHCLNDEMSKNIPVESKFKIYISALMMLNLDEHNRIATTDGRLIRRIVRDARTRGKGALGTIEMWDMVRKGEERFIFPYQDSADVVFNSSMLHELFIMRQYARPLLLGIPKNAPEYSEAKRLLKFFDYIMDIPATAVPANSILREFIGGGCFNL